MATALEAVRRAVHDLLGALAPDQREAVHLDVEDARRTEWTYLPGARHGVPLHAFARAGAKALHRLLAASVSPHTHAQVAAIMGLEDVLDHLQSSGRERHAGDYWVAVYGDPETDVVGWRLGGHHVSVHVHMVGDELRATPCFLGANPARLAHAGRTTSRPLAPEEDVAFALLAALPDSRRREAVVADRAPRDILTGDASEVGEVPSAGARLGDLAGEAWSLAQELVGVYLARLPSPLATRYRDEVVADALGDFRFAWAGADGPGAGHYYRVAGPRFLVELDNTQNGANHVHSVWRDPEGDFGGDLLAGHRDAGS